MVVTAEAGGVPSAVALVDGGQGHSVVDGLATANIVGAGTGLKLNITVLDTAAKAVSNTGTLYAGDAYKQLLFQESLPTAQVVDVAGRKIKVLLKWTLKSE